jgi:hypothetical protein
MATVEKNCRNTWEKRYKKEEERKENPYDNEENDANILKDILVILGELEERIEKSVITPNYNDDFVWNRTDGEGNLRKVLSPNFYEVQRVLVKLYIDIYSILINNKIVTLGISEDIDKSEREKELEAMRRITSA